jgi:hypothetical protein
VQLVVQYCWEVRQPKLHVAAAVHARPVSSKAQYLLLEIASQRVPATGHSAFELQVRVQRLAPPCTMGSQTSGEAQSPCEVQRSSSCLFINPPLVLLDEDEAADVVEAAAEDEAAVDEDDPLEEEDALEAGPPAPVPALELDPLAPVPVLDDVPPPFPEDPELGGTHWELTLHE